MKLKKSDLLEMLQGVIAAPDDALDCQQALPQLPAVVDAVIAGVDVAAQFPQLLAHLKLCSSCRRQFEELVDMTQLANAGALLEPARVPEFSLKRIQQRAEEMPTLTSERPFVKRLQQYLQTLQKVAPKRGIQLLREATVEGLSSLALLIEPTSPAPQTVPLREPLPPVRQLSFSAAPLNLHITLKMREFEQHRFTVRGLIEGGEKEVFAGLGISLVYSDEKDLLDCTQVDEDNTFSFHNVKSGSYLIRLDIGEEWTIFLADINI